MTSEIGWGNRDETHTALRNQPIDSKPEEDFILSSNAKGYRGSKGLERPPFPAHGEVGSVCIGKFALCPDGELEMHGNTIQPQISVLPQYKFTPI